MLSNTCGKSGKGRLSYNKNKDPKMMLPVHPGFHRLDYLPVDQLGTETETERQMKKLLEKQLDTKMNLQEHFAQHREFANSSTFTSLTELIHGECSFQKFKEIESSEERHQELQRSGLNEDEINLYMKAENNEPIKKKGFPIDPKIADEKLKYIREKVKTHETKLQQSENFKNIKKLGRHELDIEKSLYAGCPRKVQMESVIAQKSVPPLMENDPFKHIKELSEKLSCKFHKKRKREQSLSSDSVSKSSDTEFVYDPDIHHVVVPLEDTEVVRRRLHLEDIKTIPRFENYEPGIPNKILFLKNLHPKTRVQELHAVFDRFESENADPIRYRLLSGKMRGQAFLEFNDIKTAEKALAFANGYMLRERPMIIQYGREKSNSKDSDISKS